MIDLQNRLTIELQERFNAQAIGLERVLRNHQVRGKGDLRDAWNRVADATSSEMQVVDATTFEALWSLWPRSRFNATDQIRRYFRWSVQYRAPRLALSLARSFMGRQAIDRAKAPGDLQRLPNADSLYRELAAAVQREFRKQQQSLERFALGRRAVSDELDDWSPGFDPEQVQSIIVDIYEAGGAAALRQLRIDANFAITDPTLLNQVKALPLDMIRRIDETTKSAIRDILVEGQGKTIAELGSDISQYWDEANLTRGLLIAGTEMSRAAYAAELDTYERNGIEKAEIAGGLSGDICDEYIGQVYTIDEARDIVPIHPRCTHYASPVVEDWTAPATPWTGGEQPDLERVVSSRSTNALRTRLTDDLKKTPKVMVALYPDPEVANKISSLFPGGEPAETLHITLAFLGELEGIDAADRELLRVTCEQFAAGNAALKGVISGIGRFVGDDPKDGDPIYASIDAPALASFRESLVAALQAASFDLASEHGFQPHMTLTYVPKDQPMPVDQVPKLQLRFDAITLKLGPARTDFQLGKTRTAPHSTVPYLWRQSGTRARVAELVPRDKVHWHDPDDPQCVLTYDLNQTLTAGKVYPLDKEPFPGVKAWMDLAAARGACQHIHTAGMFYGSEDLEVYLARQRQVEAYCREWGLPVSLIVGKVPADVYLNDRLIYVPPVDETHEAPDWAAIGKEAERSIAQRFDVVAGKWVRKDKHRIGTPIAEKDWPDVTAREAMQDHPRGFSGPRLVADLHRTVSQSSSSLREAPAFPGAAEKMAVLYNPPVPVTILLSCAGWNPFTHDPNDWPRRLARLRMWAQLNAIPFDRLVSTDHYDLGFDDKALPFTSWDKIWPELQARLEKPVRRELVEI